MGYVSPVDGHIDGVETCVCCGRDIPEGSQVCVICGKTEPRDMVEVVRCKDCAVPHNKWTGCPKLNGLIPPPDFYCSYGERKEVTK